MSSDQPSNVPPRDLASPLRDAAIEQIWIAAAAAIGWRVERSTAAYASSDGRGNIAIGIDDILDVDDAVAQLIFHELCHGLVEGPERWMDPDWGLCNADDRDVVHEHACLRVQVYLSDPHGLRELMAPTTDYRRYHDAIGVDPLLPATDDSVALARTAIDRASSGEWVRGLRAALAATRATLDAMATLPSQNENAAPTLHPVGFPFGDAQRSCGTCAWHYLGGRGRPVGRCRQSAGPDGNGRRTEARFRACARWEAPVDCRTCGACCREAYHSVTVSVRDPVVWKQPDLVVRLGHRFEILRDGDRCAALDGAGAGTIAPALSATTPGSPTVGRPFTCRIYDDRPHACRDFEAGGRHCLVARRRVGLSP